MKLPAVAFFMVMSFIAVQTQAQQPVDIQLFNRFSRLSGQKAISANGYFVAMLKPGIRLPKCVSVIRRISDRVIILKFANPSTIEKEVSTFSAITPSNNHWKYAPGLYEKPFSKGLYLLRLYSASADFLKNIKDHIVNQYGAAYTVQVDKANTLNDLADAGEVIYIGKVNPPRPELVLTGMDLSANKVNTAHSLYPTLNGNGLTVSVKENLFDTTDVDFSHRFITGTIASSVLETHATIMGTIIGGGGNAYTTSKGVAWGTRLTSSDFANLLPDADANYRDNNIAVQNHSYGTGIENYYGADAAAYDESVTANPALVHVFSAGNSGDQQGDTGTYKSIGGYANITGSFKMAKNIITVGSLDSFYHVLPLSSKGPAYDGRIKPELVAYGTDGSSGAAAIVSGTVLLVQQAYKDRMNNLPPAALVKALLLNTADDVGNPHVDFQSGFGSVNAARAISETLAQHYFSGSITNSGVKDYTLTIPANTHQLKLLLCWTDTAAEANSYRALINDLDLELVNSDGQIFQPYVLNTSPSKEALERFAVRGRDSLNNVEQVVIENPFPGTYRVRIKGHDVMTSQQDFFVAYQWDTAHHFSWLYPSKEDNLYAGAYNIIRWQTTDSSAVAAIEISYDKGLHWDTLSKNFPILNGYRNIYIRDSFCLGQLRTQLYGHYFYSDTFTIGQRLATGVAYNCADSFMFYWQKAPGITTYNVYTLRQAYLEKLQTVTDTLIVLSKTGNPVFYAVAPVIDNRNGLKSYGFDYTAQGVECYLKNFLADFVSPAAALLRVELGTLTGIKTLTVQKITDEMVKVLYTTNQAPGLSFTITDDTLLRGLNHYRLQIMLQNGKTIFSDIQTVTYTATEPYLVFPNPVRRGQTIRLLCSELADNVFELYSALGQKILQRNLTDLYTEVAINTPAAGVYFYIIRKEGKVSRKGRIVVL